MKLITKAIARKLEKAADVPDDMRGDIKDREIIAKFFTPDAQATWYIVDGTPEDDGDWRLFGWCDLGLGMAELGYVSLNELKAVRGRFGLPVERDLYFTGHKLGEVMCQPQLETTMKTPQQFFLENAGYSHPAGADSETKRAHRNLNACELATAERKAIERGYSVRWAVDPLINSSDFDDSDEPWALWCCTLYDNGGSVLGHLGAIDFGRDGEPWGSDYCRVIEAELARDAFEHNGEG